MNPAELLRIPLLAVLVSTLGVASSGCLDGPDDEEPGYSPNVLAPTTEVRPLERNADARMKLDLNDGLPSEPPKVVLRTGYAGGNEVQYWDLGQSPTSAEPMWIFMRGDVELPLVEHPPLVDSIPGDTAYSPIRVLFAVRVTSKYQGERIPSLAALEDAIDLGLVEDPKPVTEMGMMGMVGVFAVCTVTLKEVTFETGDEALGTTRAYYRDREINHFCAPDPVTRARATFKLNAMGAPVFGNAYGLRRENQTVALDESATRFDLNGDEDTLDSNVVYDVVPGDAGYTGVWKSFDVTVPSGYDFGAVRSAQQLFDKMGSVMTGRMQVIEYKDTGLILNRPIHAVVTP